MAASSAESEFVFLDIALAMEQIGDTQAMQGMLSMLVESLVRDLPRISQMLADGDVRSANRVLHGLKGFIPIFCVEDLCKHVSEVEQLSKTGACGEVLHGYTYLKLDLEMLQAEVAEYLNDQGAAY